MVAAIQAIGSYCDPEYLRILRELMELGIAPSGNKTVDKAKLEQAKAEFIQKIKNKQDEEFKQEIQAQPLKNTRETQRTELEVQRLGAMNIAELNKVYFGLI